MAITQIPPFNFTKYDIFKRNTHGVQEHATEDPGAVAQSPLNKYASQCHASITTVAPQSKLHIEEQQYRQATTT